MLKGSKPSDFITAIFDRDVWMFHAFLDIRLRYRRSTIGPFWITLSMAIFITALGVVYTKLFNVDTKEYLPFLAVGFVIWNLISGLICDFPNIFVDNGSYIKDMKINPYVILLRLLARHLIIFLHNTIIIFGIYIYFGSIQFTSIGRLNKLNRSSLSRRCANYSEYRSSCFFYYTFNMVTQIVTRRQLDHVGQPFLLLSRHYTGTPTWYYSINGIMGNNDCDVSSYVDLFFNNLQISKP